MTIFAPDEDRYRITSVARSSPSFSRIFKVRDEIETTVARELREVQGEWMRWRHRHCTWDAAPSRGGPVQPMRYAGCVAAQTLARIDALKYHLCPDGGKAGDCEASRRYDP